MQVLPEQVCNELGITRNRHRVTTAIVLSPKQIWYHEIDTSTLGPLLFLLYINDLPNSSEKLSFRIFADDTNIFFTGNNPKEVEFTMNEEIKLVLKYCAINKLSVNFKKTNYML